MPSRCTIITRITDEDGVIGESYNADEDNEQEDLIHIINNELYELIKGKSFNSPIEVWELMVPSTFDQLRDRKLATRAIASIDSALWDLYSKKLSLPVRRIWGGCKDEIPIIGIGGYYTDKLTDINKEVEYWVNKKVSGMKFKIGRLAPEEDAKRLEIAVKEAPQDFKFIVDANQGYKYWDAVEFCKIIDSFVELEWFEEPCRWQHDVTDMANLRLASKVKIAAGQSEISSSAIAKLIINNSVDIVNFDASWGGGPTEWLRVANMAQIYNIDMGHHEEFQVASHLLSSIPNSRYVEIFEEERDPIFWNLIENRPTINDGKIKLPEQDGYGWVLDTGYIKKYSS